GRPRSGHGWARLRRDARLPLGPLAARVDEADVAVVAAVDDRGTLGIGVGEEVEVVAKQVHLQGRLLGGHRLDRKLLGLDDRGSTVVRFFFVALLDRVYRSVPSRMRTSDELALELFDLMLGLGHGPVESGHRV